MKACEEVNDSPGDVILDLREVSLPPMSSTSIPCSPWRVGYPLTCFLSGNELKAIMIVRVQERFDFHLELLRTVPANAGLPNTTLIEV